MIRNFVDRLDHFLGELMQGLYAGETIAAQHTRGLLVAVAQWCRAVFMWMQQLRPSDAELKDLRVSWETSAFNSACSHDFFLQCLGQAGGSSSQVSCTFAFKTGTSAFKQGL